MIAWSWSRIESFEKCPKKFYHENIKKDYKPDFEAPHFARGKRIHAHMENGLKTGFVNPEVKHMAGEIFKLKGADWDYVGIEDQYTLTEPKGDNYHTMQTTRWNDWSKAWVRCAIDFVGCKDDKAIVIDWKTGKNRGYKDQLKLNAGVIFHARPEITEARTMYRFIDEEGEKKKELKVFHREQYFDIWNDFAERADAIQMANENNNWPAQESYECRWCPVKECENYKGG